MEPKQPKPSEIIFYTIKDDYTITATDINLYITAPNGAHLFIGFHPYKSEKYTLNFNGITCTKRTEYAHHIYSDAILSLENQEDWLIVRYKIDKIIQDDISTFPFV